MAGLLSKGIKLGYKETSTATTYQDIPNLQEIPDLGGSADKVDVTVLTDDNYKYINGIKDFGDLSFTFLYDNSASGSNYRTLRGLEEAGNVVDWEVLFPDGTKFHFSGECSTAISGQGVNSAIQFTLNITLNSDIVVVNPVGTGSGL